MGETTAQIKRHIDAKRADVQSSISELEDKLHSVVDWRRQFQKHPGALVAVALGGGLLRGKGASPAVGFASAERRGGPGENSRHRILETIDEVKGALVGVAAARVTGILGDVIPGFRQHLYAGSGRQGSSAGRAAPGFGIRFAFKPPTVSRRTAFDPE